MIKQQIQYCHARDGVRIAVAATGKGPPLLRAGPWFSHVAFDGQSPVWAHWLRELSSEHTYIRFDQRGCGLSDWTPSAFAFESWVTDLEVVVDRLGLRRFPLFGMSQGGAIAIAYAARHPERVSHLILLGAYAQGRLRRTSCALQREEAETLLKLMRIGWGRDNQAFRQLFTSLLIPDGTLEQHRWFNELERVSTTPENALAMIEASYQIDVTALAERLDVPTLVCHARHDAHVPFEDGRSLAALIPSASFLPLESKNHVLLEDEPAWSRFLLEVRSFLGVPEARSLISAQSFAAARLTRSEFEVLTMVARGFNNHSIAATLGKSEKTVRNQISAVFGKLDVNTRAQAVVLAREAGVAGSPG
jgi:pimeloyl-ACP methyl ester carboxylesterase/DNA-binding CsgD family transcriptional regulator